MEIERPADLKIISRSTDPIPGYDPPEPRCLSCGSVSMRGRTRLIKTGDGYIQDVRGTVYSCFMCLEPTCGSFVASVKGAIVKVPR